MRLQKQVLAAGSILALSGMLVACGDESTTESKAAGALAFEQSYCKAKASEDEMPEGAMGEMTACFGEVVNNTDKKVTLTGFSIEQLKQDDDVSFEMHETVNGSMQEKEGGFTIEPGESLELAPGGAHLMVMNYEDAVPAGEDLNLTFDVEGADALQATVPVREVAAGNEDYHGGDMEEDMEGEEGEHSHH